MLTGNLQFAFLILFVLSLCTVCSTQEDSGFPCMCPLKLNPVCCNSTGIGTQLVSNPCTCTCTKRGIILPVESCPTPQPLHTYSCPSPKPSSWLIPLPLRLCCRLPNGIKYRVLSSCHCRSCCGRVIPTSDCLMTKTTPVLLKTTLRCSCPRVYDPVCCKLPSKKKVTVENVCECKCKNGSVMRRGFCEKRESGCPPIYKPVCCHHRDSTLSIKQNDCDCVSAKASAWPLEGCLTLWNA